ncbi:MAG: hypothetical protein Greene071421_254 [Parcubacteria group bacterium Greene0714_21]|nr:MAG: hypothetical protein Greene041639_281 [Parcubacteria group bacterium Greene0416_39]TSC97542.1 MAG: hypothetical protein Greene101447_467 [Parcubacteria group bacterium Greene1014_47]TSD04418.1 MAG: hypothetical protein Greene071421_254 [Parcubacteria group bacterium Greene0714_21]
MLKLSQLPKIVANLYKEGKIMTTRNPHDMFWVTDRGWHPTIDDSANFVVAIYNIAHHLKQTIPVQKPKLNAVVRFTAAGNVLSCTLESPTGKPIAGIPVECSQFNANAESVKQYICFEERTTTDSRGQANFDLGLGILYLSNTRIDILIDSAEHDAFWAKIGKIRASWDDDKTK